MEIVFLKLPVKVLWITLCLSAFHLHFSQEHPNIYRPPTTKPSFLLKTTSKPKIFTQQYGQMNQVVPSSVTVSYNNQDKNNMVGKVVNPTNNLNQNHASLSKMVTSNINAIQQPNLGNPTPSPLVRSTPISNLNNNNQNNIQKRPKITTTASKPFVCNARIPSERLVIRPTLDQAFDDRFGTDVKWRRECDSPLPEWGSYQTFFSSVDKNPKDDYDRKIPGEPNHCVSFLTMFDQIPDNGYLPTFKQIDQESMVFGVSAFFDIRIKNERKVRVLIASPYYPSGLHCQLLCKEDTEKALTIPGEVYYLRVMPSVDKFCIWQPYAISCMVPNMCTPERVALTRSQCGKPLNSFLILTVGNLDQETPLQHGVCTSTIFDFANEHVGELAEFVEANLAYGVQKIYVYDTYNVSIGVHKMLNYYVDRGIITLISWKMPKELKVLYYMGQILQYTDCMYRFMDETRYLGMFDLDDIFIPVLGESWGELFDVFEKKWNITKVASHQFGWFAACVPTTATRIPPKAGTEGREVNLRFLTHTIVGTEQWARKQILVPRGALFPHIHNLFKAMPGWKSKQHIKGLNVAIVYHYRSQNHRTCHITNPLGILLVCKKLSQIHMNIAFSMHQAGVIEKPSFFTNDIFHLLKEREIRMKEERQASLNNHRVYSTQVILSKPIFIIVFLVLFLITRRYRRHLCTFAQLIKGFR